MTLTKKRLSSARNAYWLVGCTLIAVSGCSSMDMAKDQLDRYCARRGEHPFVKEATQNGVPVVLDFGSTIVAVCYADAEREHFSDPGSGVTPLKDSKAVGRVSGAKNSCV